MNSNHLHLFIELILSSVLVVLTLVLFLLKKKYGSSRSKVARLERDIKNLHATVDGNFTRFQKSDEINERSFWILQRIFTQLAGQILNPIPDNGLINLSDRSERERLAHQIYEISEAIRISSTRQQALNFALQGKNIIVNTKDESFDLEYFLEHGGAGASKKTEFGKQ